MVIPPLLFLLALVGYPFIYGIWLSLQDRPVARAGTFVGLANFVADWKDPVFWQVTQNTFVYTIAATLLKMVGGLGLALVMNQEFKFKNTIRALMLLPFIVPTVLSTIAWMWILDPAFSIINWLLRYFEIANPGPSWLGNPHLAMLSLIIVNTWRGLPFYAITLLAGLQTGDVARHQGLEGLGGVVAGLGGEPHLPHVRDVEQAAGGACLGVLGQDAGRILHRHLVAGERHETRAEFAVKVVKRRALQGAGCGIAQEGLHTSRVGRRKHCAVRDPLCPET